MRFLSTLLAGVLAAGILFLGAPSMAFANSGDVPSSSSAPVNEHKAVVAQPGTDVESQAYEMREQASAEVQDFAGGDVVIGVSLGLLIIIVLIIILLND